MIEWIFIVAVIFIVIIIFYKQANEEFTILQCEGTQLVSLPTLLSEKYPIVLRGIQVPTFYTAESLQTNSRMKTFPIRNGKTVSDALQDGSIQSTDEASKILAQQLGLQVWGDHTWLPYMGGWSYLSFLATRARCGEQGLAKTTASATILLPTTQPVEIYILTGNQEKYFPENWYGRFPETFTSQDTVLVGSIKFMVIKIKPGNSLCLPPHWFYTIRGTDLKKPLLWCSLEAHNPLSWLSSRLEENNHASPQN
jgi:hypothetical protein